VGHFLFQFLVLVARTVLCKKDRRGSAEGMKREDRDLANAYRSTLLYSVYGLPLSSHTVLIGEIGHVGVGVGQDKCTESYRTRRSASA
jgi:hypothetical protein